MKYLGIALGAFVAGFAYKQGEKLADEIEINYAAVSQRLIAQWDRIAESMGVLDIDKER